MIRARLTYRAGQTVDSSYYRAGGYRFPPRKKHSSYCSVGSRRSANREPPSALLISPYRAKSRLRLPRRHTLVCVATTTCPPVHRPVPVNKPRVIIDGASSARRRRRRDCVTPLRTRIARATKTRSSRLFTSLLPDRPARETSHPIARRDAVARASKEKESDVTPG